MPSKKRILVDLDGVLNNYTEYDETYIPEIKTGAAEFVKELSQNADLYLFTTRNYALAKEWLETNNIFKYFKDITNTKLPAHIYIDDRAICFKGNYKKILKEIHKFKTYWETDKDFV